VTPEIFLKFREAVLEHKAIYAAYHPQLPNFLYEAMGVFYKTFFASKE